MLLLHIRPFLILHLVWWRAAASTYEGLDEFSTFRGCIIMTPCFEDAVPALVSFRLDLGLDLFSGLGLSLGLHAWGGVFFFFADAAARPQVMRQSSVWGGGPEIVALSNALCRPIHVYELASNGVR